MCVYMDMSNGSWGWSCHTLPLLPLPEEHWSILMANGACAFPHWNPNVLLFHFPRAQFLPGQITHAFFWCSVSSQLFASKPMFSFPSRKEYKTIFRSPCIAGKKLLIIYYAFNYFRFQITLLSYSYHSFLSP